MELSLSQVSLGLLGGFDPKIFKNTDLEKLIPVLEKYFSVSSEYVDLGEERSQYQAIQLTNRVGE
mgnify:CR=1 FL=1